MRVQHLEIMFIRMLHLLAHHPDFATSHDELLDIAKFVLQLASFNSSVNYYGRYIQFYLDLLATSDTISLLYHLAMKGKTVRDAESHGHSEVCRNLELPYSSFSDAIRAESICGV